MYGCVCSNAIIGGVYLGQQRHHGLALPSASLGIGVCSNLSAKSFLLNGLICMARLAAACVRAIPKCESW